MARIKHKYWVGIIGSDGRIRYVTRIDRARKNFFTECGRPAMEFSKSAANDMQEAMTANAYPSVVVQTLEYMVPFNPVDHPEPEKPDDVYWRNRDMVPA